jgi:predicted transcriptional regulator
VTNSRSPTEITIQILEVVNDCYNNNEGLTQTNLMSKLFLSHEQIKEHLMLLIEDDLLSYDSTMRTFKTSEKGLTFLQAYNQMDKVLKGQQQDLDAIERENR